QSISQGLAQIVLRHRYEKANSGIAVVLLVVGDAGGRTVVVASEKALEYFLLVRLRPGSNWQFGDFKRRFTENSRLAVDDKLLRIHLNDSPGKALVPRLHGLDLLATDHASNVFGDFTRVVVG